MRQSAVSVLALTLSASMLVFFSCTKEVSSKPSYVYKPAPKKGIVAKIAGEELTEEEFLNGIESELYEQEMKLYELKMAKIRSIVLKRFMEKDPAKKDMTNDEFLEKVISKSGKVSKKK